MHASDEIMNDTHSLLVGYLLWIFGFLGPIDFISADRSAAQFICSHLAYWALGGLWICF